jgi:O-antigen ligase
VTLGRLALLGVLVTLGWALYERAFYGTDRVGGLTSDPIRIANTAVVLGYVALTGLIADRGWRRAAYLLGPVAAGAVALLAGTRGAIVAGSIVAVFATLMIARRRPWLILGAMLVLTTVMVALVLLRGQLPRIDMLVTAVSEVLSGQPVTDGSAKIRLALLSAAWKAFHESPWVGYGWANMMTAILPYLPEGMSSVSDGQPHLHNDVADFAVSAGTLGLVSYLLILATPIAAALRSVRDSLYSERLFAVVILVGSYACLGINSLMFGFEVHTALYTSLCAAILGFCREAET